MFHLILKTTWTIAGIKAPSFSWVIAAILIVWTLYEISRLYVCVHSVSGELNKEATELEHINDKTSADRRNGLPFETFEIIRDYLRKSKLTSTGWAAYESTLAYRKRGGVEFVWSTDGAGGCFTEERLLGSSIYDLVSADRTDFI